MYKKNKIFFLTLVIGAFIAINRIIAMDDMDDNEPVSHGLHDNYLLEKIIVNKNFTDSLNKNNEYNNNPILFNELEPFSSKNPYSISSLGYSFKAKLPHSTDTVQYTSVNHYLDAYKKKYNNLDFMQICFALFIGLYEQIRQNKELKEALLKTEQNKPIVFFYIIASSVGSLNNNIGNEQYGVYGIEVEKKIHYQGKNAVGKFLMQLRDNPDVFDSDKKSPKNLPQSKATKRINNGTEDPTITASFGRMISDFFTAIVQGLWWIIRYPFGTH